MNGSKVVPFEGLPDKFAKRGQAVQQLFVGIGRAAARWTRLEYEGPDRLPDPPALIVANHGFGGVFDLNALTIAALAERLRPREDVQFTILTHQIAWTLGLGPVLEPAGLRVASMEAALEGLAAGHYVLVMPGGDLDAGKSFARRNEIVFGGRTGFAKLALEADVPIVPVVMSGAGETLFVLSDGKRLAKLLRLPELLRVKTLPVSLSIPYGLSIGVAGMLPYCPLPAKMRAAVLDPIRPACTETAESLASRVHDTMSAKLAEMTAGRVPFFGMRWDEVFRSGPR
jgi:1-acyl-sn-glycerol-3-phosphate acyltransferase